MNRGYVLAQEVRVGDVLHFLGRDRLVTSIESYPGVPGILPTGRIAYSSDDWAMVLHDGLTTWVEVVRMADPLPTGAAVSPHGAPRGEPIAPTPMAAAGDPLGGSHGGRSGTRQSSPAPAG